MALTFIGLVLNLDFYVYYIPIFLSYGHFPISN